MSALDELLRARGIGSPPVAHKLKKVADRMDVLDAEQGSPKTPASGPPRIYRDVVQGTEEWKRLRLGIPTASQFHRIVTPKGAPSKSQEAYRHELIAERLLGEEMDDFESKWMTRGKETELEAVNYYELQRGVDVERIGFILNDARTVGASPDGLVGDDGLAEIKVCKPSTHVGYLLQDGSAYAEHMIQAQGQLWIAQRPWNDLVSYCPGLPSAIHRVERDEVFIKALEKEMREFSEKLEALFAACMERGWVRERPVRETTQASRPAPLPPQDELVKAAMNDLNAGRL